MTLRERLEQLTKDGLPVTRYGEGRITHVCFVGNDVPILAELWLSEDCRESGVDVNKIDHVIRCTPFKNRETLEMFKDSISRIEKLMDETGVNP